MLDNYDPNRIFGEHTIKITLQQWEYKGTLQLKVHGNCKGLSVMSSIADLAYNQSLTLESDCDFKVLEPDDDEIPWYRAILKDSSGNELITEDLLDDLEDTIVAIEIIDFVPEHCKIVG